MVDTAEKFGVSKRTVEENLQIAKDLTPNAKKIIQNSGKKVKKKEMLKLARLPPEHQEEAARQLTTGAIHSVDDHQPPPVQPVPQGEETGPEPECDPPPYDLGGTPYTTFEESIADLKNHDKDCSYTADTLLLVCPWPISGTCPWTRISRKRNALPNFSGRSGTPTASGAASSLSGRGLPTTAYPWKIA